MKNVVQFLSQIRENNQREWFEANRTQYEEALKNMIHLADAILLELQKHDEIETPNGKKSLKRIYRDTRFSKDKTPYKTFWSGSFVRAGKQLRGGYYFHIEPQNSFVGGGFWNPNPDDLKLIRTHLEVNGAAYREIIESAEFKKAFGTVRGDQLKKAPKSFDPEGEFIDFIKFKQFLVLKPISDEEVIKGDLPKLINNTFQEMRPFFNLMSEFLTTDLNGIELY